MYAHFFMVPMHVTLQNGTTYANYGMHGIINECHTTYIWHGTNACHTILWHGNNSCHSIALCQYVTLWHEANACHRYEIRHIYVRSTNCNIHMPTLIHMAWHQCRSHSGA